MAYGIFCGHHVRYEKNASRSRLEYLEFCKGKSPCNTYQQLEQWRSSHYSETQKEGFCAQWKDICSFRSIVSWQLWQLKIRLLGLNKHRCLRLCFQSSFRHFFLIRFWSDWLSVISFAFNCLHRSGQWLHELVGTTGALPRVFFFIRSLTTALKNAIISCSKMWASTII